VLKINVLLLIMSISTSAWATCVLNENSDRDNHYFKGNINMDTKSFKLEQFEDDRIISRDNDFFVWAANGNYFFTEYVMYSGIGYTREMIVNSEFVCSVDEMSHILKKNKNNRVRVVLINNPYSKNFLNRSSKLLVKKSKYSDFVESFVTEATENNVAIEIDDEDNLEPFVHRLIK